MSSRSISRQTGPCTPDHWRRVFAAVLVVVAAVAMLLCGLPGLGANAQATTITFTGGELIGKPTNNSVAINIVPAASQPTIEYYYEYGTSPGSYPLRTPNYTATASQPSEIIITGLSTNTLYYYRMVYDGDGDVDDGDYEVRDPHTFRTQRGEGETFVFTVTSDDHDSRGTRTQNSMVEILNAGSELHFDLGDTFYTDSRTSQSQVNTDYLNYRDPLVFGKIGTSIPIFTTAGNHENEEGWNLDDTPFSIALGSIQARKAYYPTPVTDGFYTGNTDPLAAIDEVTYGDELREDYYAWEWGDALFVVIDEYQYTMANPYGSAAGEGSDDPDTADQWIWTLGLQQYNWLKTTLENSDAKYKFVFSHNVTGGIPRNISGVDAGYVRGGAEAAKYFEWGGYNYDGTTWGFSTQRPGWGVDAEHPNGTPIHQLFVENGVSAYFHGHDHQYVYETRDGVVYQEVPSPSMTGMGFDGIYTEGTYAEYSTIRRLASGGHLELTVTPTLTTVDYISSADTSGTVTYSYTIEPNYTGPTHQLTMAVSPGAGGTTSPGVGPHTYAENATVGITATPAVGYVFSSWAGDVANPASASTTVTMNADKTVTANFVTQDYNLSVAASPGAGGTTTPSGTTNSYPAGQQVTLTATPATGYVFTSWTGDAVANSTSATTTILMNGSKSVTANFVQQSYTLTMQVSPSPGGTTNPTVGGSPYTYAAGTVVDISATANSGYTFSSWTGGVANSGSASTTVTMTSNKIVTANFTGNTYTITASASSGGSISPSGAVSVAHGGSQTFTITANTGYHVSSVLVDGSSVGAVTSYTFNNVTANHTISASFALNTYTLSYSAGTGGSLTGATAQTVNYGASGTAVTAVPSSGYHFVRWSDGITANPRTDTNVTANVAVSAVFALETHTITASAGTGGGISPSGAVSVEHGANQSFTVTPNTGYHVSNVLVDGSSVGAVTTYQFTNVTVNHTISATFALNTYTITATAGAGGSISPSGGVSVSHGSSPTFTITASSGYHVVDVLVDGSSVGVVTSYQFTDVAASHTIDASFVLNMYTITASAGTGGSISPSGAVSVSHGGSRSFTISPNTGYHIADVLVDGSSVGAVITYQFIVVTAGHTIAASFAPNTYTLTYLTSTGGSVTGPTPQTVAHGEDGAAVTAVAGTGYRFVQWSDGSTANPRTDSDVTGNLTVTAQFAVNDVAYSSIRGSHRYQTAQLISQAMFPGPLPAGSGAVVAPGETFQEALCGAPLAAAYGGPVLLTSQAGLENGTKAELQRLFNGTANPTIFVIGLSTAIRDAVADTVPAATVVLIPGPVNGTNVYAMSRTIANHLAERNDGLSGATAIITIGTNFPDAIGVAPVACPNRWPILLTDQPGDADLHTEAATALAELGITKVIKVGTYATLPDGVTSRANLSGADRYVTNANVATWAKANAGLSFANVAMATGDKFPDALASGPYLARNDGILLLSPLLGPLPTVIGNVITANAASVQKVTFIACIEPVIGQVKALLP